MSYTIDAVHDAKISIEREFKAIVVKLTSRDGKTMQVGIGAEDADVVIAALKSAASEIRKK